MKRSRKQTFATPEVFDTLHAAGHSPEAIGSMFDTSSDKVMATIFKYQDIPEPARQPDYFRNMLIRLYSNEGLFTDPRYENFFTDMHEDLVAAKRAASRLRAWEIQEIDHLVKLSNLLNRRIMARERLEGEA